MIEIKRDGLRNYKINDREWQLTARCGEINWFIAAWWCDVLNSEASRRRFLSLRIHSSQTFDSIREFMRKNDMGDELLETMSCFVLTNRVYNIVGAKAVKTRQGVVETGKKVRAMQFYDLNHHRRFLKQWILYNSIRVRD